MGSYLGLTKQILEDNLSEDQLIDCLDIPNIPVLQKTILKIIEKNMNNDKVHIKLLEYSKCMDNQFKISALCKLGHLSIYALKRLGYHDDFEIQYQSLPEYDKEEVDKLETALKGLV